MLTERVQSVVAVGIMCVCVGLGCQKEKLKPTPNLDSCRISKETYKSIWIKGRKSEDETVTIGDKSFQIVKQSESKYVYNVNGQLIEENAIYTTLGSTSRVTYTYAPSAIIKRGYYDAPQYGGYYEQTDTIPINLQGLALKHSNRSVRYDEQGYLVQVYGDNNTILESYTQQNGNIMRMHYTVPAGSVSDMNYFYEYNLTRKNLPNKYTFYGRLSSNLPKKQVYRVERSTYISPGPVYEINYSYDFDRYGRVKRRIAHGVSLNPLWSLESDTDGIGITDFEYDCPQL